MNRVYPATVVRVEDGDGLVLDVDVGFFAHIIQPFRLLGCNARELAQPGGPEARDHLAELLTNGSRVTVTSVKPDKFGGRWDGAITLADGTDLVAELIAQQWAAAWNGVGPKPSPPWPRP